MNDYAPTIQEYEIEVLCDDGEVVWKVVEADNFDLACDIAFNDALEAGEKPVQCESPF